MGVSGSPIRWPLGTAGEEGVLGSGRGKVRADAYGLYCSVYSNGSLGWREEGIWGGLGMDALGMADGEWGDKWRSWWW